MLSKEFRLHHRDDITRVFKKGKKIVSPLFLFFFLPNRSDNPRLTVVVSTKVHKSAVKRNLLKRRARESIKTILKKTSSIPNIDIVLLARKDAPCEQFIFKNIDNQVHKALSKILTTNQS